MYFLIKFMDVTMCTTINFTGELVLSIFLNIMPNLLFFYDYYYYY